ncbi:MAG: alpha/beta hydrolase [Myxococcota bacterium]|nr:alpha/beta hydrolase [Myxococcota bacterium]
MKSSLVAGLRRRAGAVVVDGFFRGLARVGLLHPMANPDRHNVIVEREVAYSTSELPEHRLDVYRPRHADGPVPIVLYVHGGGFRILSKDTHWLMGLAFARRGYLVFNISYRLAPLHRFPAALEDTCEALRWVKENAARWGGDPERIVFAGESAGANLVTSLALACCYERDEPFAKRVFELGVRPRAVIPACGIFQVSDVQRFARRRPGRIPKYVMDRLEEVSDAYLGRPDAADTGHDARALDLADPVCFLERGEQPVRALPPFFLPVGTKDPLLDDTRRLARALEQLGTEAVTRFYPGEIHAFHAMIFRESARACWGHTFEFLDRHCPAVANVERIAS